MIVVSDSSPLIALARVGWLDFLSKLYPVIHVPTEVYNEVVVAGAGLPGASEVARAVDLGHGGRGHGGVAPRD